MPHVYHTLGRFIYYNSLPLLIIYSKLTKPRVRGIIIHDNKVLLVKNWLGSQEWTFPGGGVQARESERAALSRELHEELSIVLPSDLFEHIAKLPSKDTSLYYPVSIYAVTLPDTHLLANLSRNRREIVDVAWFELNALPPRRHQELYDIYDSYVASKKI